MSGTGGWYPDPHDPSRARWWDGEWTEHVRDPSPTAAVATLEQAPAPWPTPPAAEAPVAALTPPAAEAPLAPPMPPAPSPPPAPALEDEKPRSSVSPVKVAIAVLAVGLLVLGGLWAAGVLPTEATGTSTSSGTGETAFQGPGYTVNVPAEWSQQGGELATNVDAAFTVPPAAQLTVGSVEGDATELADDAARQAAFDTMLRVQLSVYPDVVVISQEPATLDGAPGERITLEGPGPSGTTVRVVEVVAVRDGTIVFLGIEGPPDAVEAAVPTFDGVIGSFRFGD